MAVVNQPFCFLNRMNDGEGCRIEGSIALDGVDIYDASMNVVDFIQKLV